MHIYLWVISSLSAKSIYCSSLLPRLELWWSEVLPQKSFRIFWKVIRLKDRDELQIMSEFSVGVWYSSFTKGSWETQHSKNKRQVQTEVHGLDFASQNYCSGKGRFLVMQQPFATQVSEWCTISGASKIFGRRKFWQEKDLLLSRNS